MCLIGRAHLGHLISAITNQKLSRKVEDRLLLSGLYYSDSVDFLVLPRITSHRCLGSKAARSTSLLSDMVRMSAASAASDVGRLAACLSERSCTLGHVLGPE